MSIAAVQQPTGRQAERFVGRMALHNPQTPINRSLSATNNHIQALFCLSEFDSSSIISLVCAITPIQFFCGAHSS